jgi:hypothetical protein
MPICIEVSYFHAELSFYQKLGCCRGATLSHTLLLTINILRFSVSSPHRWIDSDLGKAVLVRSPKSVRRPGRVTPHRRRRSTSMQMRRIIGPSISGGHWRRSRVREARSRIVYLRRDNEQRIDGDGYPSRRR